MLSEQAQKWFPTHVQVTVLQAKDLKPKGKSGTNDTYTIIQLGKEKYSTSVAEKTLEPVWKEEASFELPGLLMQGNPIHVSALDEAGQCVYGPLDLLPSGFHTPPSPPGSALWSLASTVC